MAGGLGGSGEIPLGDGGSGDTGVELDGGADRLQIGGTELPLAGGQDLRPQFGRLVVPAFRLEQPRERLSGGAEIGHASPGDAFGLRDEVAEDRFRLVATATGVQRFHKRHGGRLGGWIARPDTDHCALEVLPADPLCLDELTLPQGRLGEDGAGLDSGPMARS